MLSKQLFLQSQNLNLYCDSDSSLLPKGLTFGMKEGGEAGRKKKKQTFHLAPQQSVDLHVEGLIGVRWAPNQRNMAGNASEPHEKTKKAGLHEP